MATLYLVVLLISAFAWYCLVNLFAKGLQKFPGPILAKLSDIWRLVETWKGHYERRLRDLHRKHGAIVRVGPCALSIADPDAIDIIYGATEDLSKSNFYSVMQNTHKGKALPGLVTVASGKSHAALRRPIAHVFAIHILTQSEPFVDKTIHELIRSLDARFISGSASENCDIDKWSHYFAFDVLGELVFSHDFGFLKQGKDIDHIIHELSENWKYCSIIGQMPILDRFLRKNPVLRYFRPLSSSLATRARRSLTDRLCAEGSLKDSNRRDFISRFLEAKEKYPDELSDQAVLGYVTTVLSGGADTIATTLRSIIYYLLKNPLVISKLQLELDKAKLSYPVSWGDSQRLVFVDAVIREALRIHPPGAILLERTVTSDKGLRLPDGSVLAKDTIVGMTGWTVGQNRQVFGEDAHIFNPDRWLPAAGESDEFFQARLSRMKRADFVFGHGPRACLGKNIANLELYKTVPTLFGLFDMSLVNPQREWRYEGYFVAHQHDITVHLKWRNENDKASFLSNQYSGD